MRNGSAAPAVAAALAAVALLALPRDAGAGLPKPIWGEAIGPKPPPHVDLVLAIDGTGSMFDEVSAAKGAALAAIDLYADAAPAPVLRVGVVVYRDKIDDAARIERLDLGPDIAAVRRFIAAIVPHGGGDRRESVFFALQTAIREMAWDPERNTAKTVLLIGDAPSKTYAGEPGIDKLAPEARKKKIALSAVAITRADDTITEFTKISDLGGGGVALVDPPPPRTDVPRSKPPGRDVVFVVDTTGSMGSVIDAVRAKVHKLAKAMAEEGGGGDSTLQEFAEVRFGLVDYRDRGDAWVAKMRTPLTSDISHFLAEVNKLSADGGGDWPESVTKALVVALDDKMGWDPMAGKAIVLVGDAEPHRYGGEPSYEDVARDAGARTIPINTVACSGDTEVPPFKKIASLSGGDFYRLASLGKAVDHSVTGK